MSQRTARPTKRSILMQNFEMERIAVLERRQRLFLAVNVVLFILLVVVVGGRVRDVQAQQKQDAKALVLSELAIVDSRGIVRARLGGDLPDANKVTPRGSRIAGLLLYDETGHERSGYVTFEPG